MSHPTADQRVRNEGLERLMEDMQGEYTAGAEGYFLTRREMKRVLTALSNQDGRRNEEPSSQGGFGTTAREPSSAQSPTDVTTNPTEKT